MGFEERVKALEEQVNFLNKLTARINLTCYDKIGFTKVILDLTRKPIESDEEYKEVLQAIESLMKRDPNPNSGAGKNLHRLCDLVQTYEERVVQ